MKVAIVGCGKQADAHASLIARMPGCQIVAASDNEKLMARQLAERYNAPHYFDNLVEMLEKARPDVVHVNAPPQAHVQIGKSCFAAGVNVFFEKPFATTAAEAEQLIRLADEAGCKLTVGHNNQFNNCTIRMRELVQGGFLGGNPVHMESVWGYDLGDTRFAAALLGDASHWIRKLPGNLLHNIISHGVAKIAEFMQGQSPTVIAHGFTSAFLKRIKQNDIVDELRVIIDDQAGTTAYFTFTTQVKPMVRQFRIYGPQNSIIVDDMHETVMPVRRTDYKSYLNNVVPGFLYAKDQLKGATGNMRRFFSRELHFDAGRRRLIELFYRSIADGTAPPIPYSEIVRTSRIMDAAFAQLQHRTEQASLVESVK